MDGLKTGDIANQQGDIVFSPTGSPISAGRLALPLRQALPALLHGWRWIGTHSMSNDEQWITVQRGGVAWEVRHG